MLIDIIIFAAIAYFIFSRLNKQLGNIDTEEKKTIQEIIKKQKESIAEMQNNVMKQVKSTVNLIDAKISAENKIISNLDEESKQNMIKILQSCNITAEFFINGVKSAFEMVIKAFSSEDLETLKILLSNQVYQGFETSILARKENNQILTTNLIAVESAEILSAMIMGDFASIAVKINSQQINYISDLSGNIIDGSKEEISSLSDVWTFKKDLTVENPNWTIFSTNLQ